MRGQVSIRLLVITSVLSVLVAIAVAVPVVAQVVEPRVMIANGEPIQAGIVNRTAARTNLRSASNSSTLQLQNISGATPLDLRSQEGVPSLKVNRATRVPRLNADRVDGKHANQLIRAAFGATDDAADSDGDAVTATITAPAAGILVMSGSIEAFAASAVDLYTCILTVGGSVVEGTRRDSVVHWAGTDHTTNDEENCATDGAQVVAAGTHTVALNINNQDTVQFGAASVWVIWVPFDGTGAVPTP